MTSQSSSIGCLLECGNVPHYACRIGESFGTAMAIDKDQLEGTAVADTQTALGIADCKIVSWT